MSDLIDRQEAIDVVRKWFALIGLNGDICIDGITSLPTAEPEPRDDAVSRKAVVSRISDLLMIELEGKRLPTWNEVYRAIGELPTVQPDVVRCGECKHNPKRSWFGCPMSGLNERQRPETAWCWKGERESNGRPD